MVPANPQISVVICTYNRANYLPGALESLSRQGIPADNYEVIIVNNASTDQTAAVCQAYIAAHPEAPVFYLEEHRQGASFARNTGAAMARSPLLCFMDDDAVADVDYLQKILAFFQEVPAAGGLGGRIIPRYLPAEPKWMSHYVSSLVGHFHYSDTRTPFSGGKYPLESNMIIRTEDFRQIGGFSAALPGVVGTVRIGGEGKDLFYRLMQLGRVIYYDPAVRVEHVVETEKLTPAYLYRVASGIGRGERVRILKKGTLAFLLKIAEYLFKLAAAILLGIGYALQGHPARTMPVIQFRIDALKGLFNQP
jgi:glycosyltransferase involved in cell wall biosynthesis